MRRRTTAFVVLTAVATLAFAATAPAQAVPNQVTGLAAEQNQGFATLSWEPVPGATSYQVERSTVGPTGVVGTGTIVGLWQPQRTVTPESPRFADAGFALGGRYQWRVRARFGTTVQPYSDPVVDTTLPQWGSGPGAGLRTEWESSGNATYTTYAGELAYTAAIDAASDRVRVVELGRTNPATGRWAPGDRAINMLILGYPTARATAAEISDSPTIAFNCNVHGDEPQGRESCFILARMLAFTEDPHLLEILSNVNVLIVPSINGNGRAGNTRGNETGTDLNRDHAELAQPETKAFAAMLRDYTPEVALDLHEGDTEDLPVLTARHLNVHQPLFDEGKTELVESWMYENAARSGWWVGPYNNGGDSHEGILRNTLGLKNTVGMLAENRPNGGTTRPAEGTPLANRNRKSYGSLWEEFQALEYYWTRLPEIHAAVERSIAYQRSNVGRVVLRGAYPWPPFFSVGADIPAIDAPIASRILEPPPCGYLLNADQFSGARIGGTMELRLGLHGIAQQTRPLGHLVRLAQPLRGLIPMLLDAASADPSPIVAAARLYECPYVTAAPRSISTAAVEGSDATESLTIGNDVAEEEPLDWTITEAVSDCASPSDVDWLSTDATAGTTGAGSTSTVEVRTSAASLTAPARPTALLCLASNDAGESLIAIPVTFQVQYSFTGFFAPIANLPAANDANAGASVPMKFVIAGGSGLSIVLGGSPTSQPVDCESLSALGEAEAISTPGSSGFRFREEDSAYHANWKTEKEWAGTCRLVSVSLDDGTQHSALYRFG